MNADITVKDIVKKYLRENGFDGLAHKEAGCACGIDALMGCYTDISKCVPVYRWECAEGQRRCLACVAEGVCSCYRTVPQPKKEGDDAPNSEV
jgi:hypothetical protein